MKQYTTIEAVEYLAKDSKVVFQRVNDENFELYRNVYGNLMMKLNLNNQTIAEMQVPLFNYYYELWVLKKEEK